MLTVLTPDEALALIKDKISPLCRMERVDISAAPGRVLAAAVCAREYVPGFDRSTVDGYALRAADSFGCSEAIPALLQLERSVSRLEQKIAASAMEEKQILDRLWDYYELSHTDAQARKGAGAVSDGEGIDFINRGARFF